MSYDVQLYAGDTLVDHQSYSDEFEPVPDGEIRKFPGSNLPYKELDTVRVDPPSWLYDSPVEGLRVDASSQVGKNTQAMIDRHRKIAERHPDGATIRADLNIKVVNN
jgi:hypothetical protein